MMMVHCRDTTCRHNNGEVCMLPAIKIDVEPTNEFREGKRVVYSVCQNYKEKEDAGED
ncbi:MAG: DUF1540 domain-containing protein [Lachnospiraceae bacterium]|nr:DUF1540 domain-containing protein [Lachnospiraceae bacterium]